MPRRCQWRPSTADENIEAVKEKILYKRYTAIREIADNVCTSFGSCHAIFADLLGMKRAAAKIVKKIAKLWAKTISYGHPSGDIDNVQQRSRFAQKYHN